MAILDVFKSDLERVWLAVDKQEVDEFCRLLARVSDGDVSSLFDEGIDGRFACFLSMHDLRESVIDRLVRCLFKNSNSRVSSWFERSLGRCLSACRDCHDCNCAPCRTEIFSRRVLERIGSSYALGSPYRVVALLNRFWLFVVENECGSEGSLLRVVHDLLTDGIDAEDIMDSIFDVYLSEGQDKVYKFKVMWRMYDRLSLMYGNGCHKSYFDKVAKEMEFDAVQQRQLLQWALEKGKTELFVTIVDTYGADVTSQTTQGFNIAMKAAVSCDMKLLTWALEKQNGESLLHHKTYNGKTVWDFAREKKNGELMNFLKERSYHLRRNSNASGLDIAVSVEMK